MFNTIWKYIHVKSFDFIIFGDIVCNRMCPSCLAAHILTIYIYMPFHIYVYRSGWDIAAFSARGCFHNFSYLAASAASPPTGKYEHG